MDNRTRKVVALATLGAMATAGVAAIAAANPAVRSELRRLRQFARRLDDATLGPPVPPRLPPGRIVVLEGRGEVFARDTESEGPAVLLLHGWGATADLNFFNAYPALDGYRVVALDHRGHGRGLRSRDPVRLVDCADDAEALLEALGIERAIVVGYSMGGPIALLLAQRHRERCAGLVLQATALEFHSGTGERALWRGMTVIEAALRHGSGDGVVQRLLRESVDRNPALAPLLPWLDAEMRRGHIQSVVDVGRDLSRFDATRVAPTLDLPSAVVVTNLDRLVPPHKQRALAAAMDARVFEIEGDHDACLVNGARYGEVTRAAVDDVARRSDLIGSAGSRRTG